MSRRQILSDWIREQLNVAILGNGSTADDMVNVGLKCTALALMHIQNGRQVEVKTLRIGSKSYDPKDLAIMFETAADNMSGGIPGLQQFQILAFFDDKESPQATYSFRRQGEIAPGSDGSSLATEPPTNSGIVTQLMRHTEFLARNSAAHQEALLDRMLQLFDRQQSAIDRLQAESHDSIELAKTVIMEKAVAEHQRGMELIKARQSAEERAKMLQLAPAVINRVFDREIFPQSTADTSLFDSLAESIEPAQIQALQQIMKPEQWALIADRLVEALKKKEAKNA